MRIVQLIDSLDAGGAERVAVNYANSLLQQTGFSALATTRKEGVLKGEINGNVGYIFLKKTGRLGIEAVSKLKTYCESEKITHLHAHGSSWFTAFLTKLFLPQLKIVWHNHNGRSEQIKGFRLVLLRLASRKFSGILSVNDRLNNWAIANLKCPNVRYLPNFVLRPTPTQKPDDLKGEDGKRILCLANLRDPKGHMTLLKAVESAERQGWTLHLVGKDYQDDYSSRIKAFISGRNLGNVVYLYGSRKDASAFVSACDICVLSSDAEGLPLALLEYGMHERPVVATAVGEIPNMIKDSQNGFLVNAGDNEAMKNALQRLIRDAGLRQSFARGFNAEVSRNFSETAVLGEYLKWLKSI